MNETCLRYFLLIHNYTQEELFHIQIPTFDLFALRKILAWI